MALFKTSAEAKDILENQHRRSGIRPHLWARAAFAYSLSLESPPEDVRHDSDGKEFNEGTFFGDDEAVLMALLRQRVGCNPPPSEIGALVKAHVERGVRQLNSHYQRVNSHTDELIRYLLSVSPTSPVPTSKPQIFGGFGCFGGSV